MENDTKTTKPARSDGCRWTRGILFVSLAVNLLVVGAVAGVALNGGPPKVLGKEDNAAMFLRALEPRDRRAMLMQLRAAGQGPAAARREARAQFRALLTALRDDPFDADSFAAALARQSRAAEERRAIGQEAFVSRIASMSVEDRAAFADRLEDVLKRHKPPKP